MSKKKAAAILAMGTVAVDSIETPAGKRERCFGGSASYFSYAASFFSTTKILAVVGDDFPTKYREILEGRKVDLSGLDVRKDQKTFFWRGKYEGAMNEAETLTTELNVLLSFSPKLTPEDTQPICFLANIDPEIQLNVLDHKRGTEFSMVDTMNFWINSKRDALCDVLARVDAMVINEGEARQLSGKTNLIRAGEALQKLGPEIVVLKKGEHGVLLFFRDKFCAVPAFPVRDVIDPTGAGDSFAGGMVGFLGKMQTYDFTTFKKALLWGTATASFTVEGFSLERLQQVTKKDLEKRFKALQAMMRV